MRERGATERTNEAQPFEYSQKMIDYGFQAINNRDLYHSIRTASCSYVDAVENR